MLPATFVSCNTEGIFSLNLVHVSFIFASLQLEIVQRTLDPFHFCATCVTAQSFELFHHSFGSLESYAQQCRCDRQANNP
jgi:hypothetical protein